MLDPCSSLLKKHRRCPARISVISIIVMHPLHFGNIVVTVAKSA